MHDVLILLTLCITHLSKTNCLELDWLEHFADDRIISLSFETTKRKLSKEKSPAAV